MTDHISKFGFSLSPEVAASGHDGGIVILHLAKGRVFSANQTGALIWRGLEQRRSLEGIVAEIRDQFQIPGTTARTHAINFLAALEQQALIKREVAS